MPHLSSGHDSKHESLDLMHLISNSHLLEDCKNKNQSWAGRQGSIKRPDQISLGENRKFLFLLRHSFTNLHSEFGIRQLTALLELAESLAMLRSMGKLQQSFWRPQTRSNHKIIYRRSKVTAQVILFLSSWQPGEL